MVRRYGVADGGWPQGQILAPKTLPPPHLGPPRDRPLQLVELERPAVRDPLVEYLTPSQYVPLADEIRQVATNLARGAGGDGAAFWIGLLAYFRDNLTYETGST